MREWIGIRRSGNGGRGMLLGNLAMVIVVLFWGSSFVSIKIAVSAVPPVTMALLRFMMATAILAVLLRKREPGVKLANGDFRKIGLSGFLGVTLYFYLENNGIRLTTASNAALITSVIPVLATLLDIGVYKARISPGQVGGMLLALAGSYLAITANGQVRLESSPFRGNLFIIGAMVTWALYTLSSKSIGSRYSGLYVTTMQYLVGTVLLIPLALTEYREWRPVPPYVWVHLVFLATFCSAGCYLLYQFALRKLDVTVTTMYLNLVPLVGVACGSLFLRESILPVQLAGGALILAGILVVNLKRSPKSVPIRAAEKDGTVA